MSQPNGYPTLILFLGRHEQATFLPETGEAVLATQVKYRTSVVFSCLQAQFATTESYGQSDAIGRHVWEPSLDFDHFFLNLFIYLFFILPIAKL